MANYRRLLMLLGVAAVLPLLPTGMFAGLVLSMMVAGWLVVSNDRPANYPLLWGLTMVVMVMNLVFTIGALT